jgi:hypothetical protein
MKIQGVQRPRSFQYISPKVHAPARTARGNNASRGT